MYYFLSLSCRWMSPKKTCHLIECIKFSSTSSSLVYSPNNTNKSISHTTLLYYRSTTFNSISGYHVLKFQLFPASQCTPIRMTPQTAVAIIAHPQKIQFATWATQNALPQHPHWSAAAIRQIVEQMLQPCHKKDEATCMECRRWAVGWMKQRQRRHKQQERKL